jgi:hypothetical protein
MQDMVVCAPATAVLQWGARAARLAASSAPQEERELEAIEMTMLLFRSPNSIAAHIRAFSVCYPAPGIQQEPANVTAPGQ